MQEDGFACASGFNSSAISRVATLSPSKCATSKLTLRVSFEVALFAVVIDATLEIAEALKPEAQAKPSSCITASLALQASIAGLSANCSSKSATSKSVSEGERFRKLRFQSRLERPPSLTLRVSLPSQFFQTEQLAYRGSDKARQPSSEDQSNESQHRFDTLPDRSELR